MKYQNEFPSYFKLVLDKINVDFENCDYRNEEKEAYKAGEEINKILENFIISGIENGDLRKDLKIIPTIINFWGMLSGLIQLASSKEDYLKKSMGMSKNQFLNYAFQMLYNSISNK